MRNQEFALVAMAVFKSNLRLLDQVPLILSVMSSIRAKLHPLAAAMVFAGCPLAVRGADFTVDSAADDGPGSLREAVMLANADFDSPHNIYFDLPPATTITLTSGEIEITRSLTLHGPGVDQLTVSGNLASRIFRADNSGLLIAEISGMTLTDGYMDGSTYEERGGGAVMVRGTAAHLIVRDSLVTSSSSASGNGGGLRGMLGADITCQNSRVVDNQAPSGGGISLTGNLTLDECEVSGNLADFGGGIYLGIGHLDAVDSVISDNNGALSGGGVFLFGQVTYFGDSYPATSEFSNSVISGNTTTGSGGCIAGYYADISLIDSELSTCQAGFDGGAVVIYGNSYQVVLYSELVISGSQILDNQANRNGGGIAGALVDVDISNSIISGNSADTAGGGMHLHTQPLLSLNHSEFSDNTALGGSALSVVGNRSSSLLHNVTITGNQADFLTLNFTGGDDALMSSSLVAHNQAQDNPGVGLFGQAFELVNSTISNNVALDPSTSNSGTALIVEAGTVRLYNNTIAFNEALTTDPGGAGAVYLEGSSTLDLTSNLIALNTDQAMVPEDSQVRRTALGTINALHNLLSDAPAGLFNGLDTNNLILADPGVLPLADNGGNSPTVALAPDSPAREVGLNPRSLVLDQRGAGFPREFGTGVDIGAFEFGPNDLVDRIFADRFE
jgi:hypothetical protein